MMRNSPTSVIKFALGVAVTLTAALSGNASARQQPAPGARPQASPPQAPPPQTSPPQTSPSQASPTRPARANEAGADADLSITARVTADSLRFEKVPNPRVEFTGRPARDTVWEAERENLPRPVQPGVTYRDVGITLRITSVFADIDRIVAEALGEVPVNDGAPPAQPSPAPPERPAAAPPSDSTTPPASAAANTPRRRAAHKGRRN